MAPDSNWPERPYRGLDFYRESDAPLFREREGDAGACKDLLQRFGVKVLLLQGSSGCGKSSFLRAGLIPALKINSDGGSVALEKNAGSGKTPSRRLYFLSGREIVIRCTSNPLGEITQSILAALRSGDTTFVTGDSIDDKYETLLDDSVRHNLIANINQLIKAPSTPDQLATELIETLLTLVADLPGQLILILDQAEEVLTREGSNAASQAFFRFLESIYIRNVDLRVVLSLRTEYYGRFRDELKISDDRLAERPKSGGVHPYLLRPLRDKASLIRIVKTPTYAIGNDGHSVYDFSYADGLVEKIVEDLLAYFTHSSVTPALQVVCASLYDRLTEEKRTITHEDYRNPGDIGGILSDYVERGIRNIGSKGSAEIDKWRMTLYRLVSRQGGGTVVSLAETAEDLELTARSEHIDGDVRKAFVDLTTGSMPLLRAEPPDNPSHFSLKHDVLAVVLSRWYDEHDGAIKAQQEERERQAENEKRLVEERKRFTLKWSLGAASATAVLAFALFAFQGATAFKEKARVIQLRSDYVGGDTNNFRNDLLLTLVSLDEIQYLNYWYGALTGQAERIKKDLVDQLRSVAQRAPRYVGRYRSASFDPSGHLLAFFGPAGIELVTLDADITSPPEVYELPPDVVQSPTATIGFMSGIGVAVYSDEKVFWWHNKTLKQVDLADLIPRASLPKIRVAQFAAGQLYIFLSEGNRITSAFSLKPEDLTLQRMLTQQTLAVDEKLPLFSNRTAGLYGFLAAQVTKAKDNSGVSEGISQLLLRNLNDPTYQRSIDVGPGGLFENQTMAFAVNKDAVVVTGSGGKFYVVTISDSGLATDRVTLQFSADRDRELRSLFPGQVYSPLAVVRVGQSWRLAWPGRSGVVVVENGGEGSTDLKQMFGKPLLGSTPLAAGMQFSVDGNFLMLNPSSTISLFVGFDVIEVWDLRRQRQLWLERGDLSTLRKEACRVAQKAGNGTALSKIEKIFFSIDAGNDPCASNLEAIP